MARVYCEHHYIIIIYFKYSIYSSSLKTAQQYVDDPLYYKSVKWQTLQVIHGTPHRIQEVILMKQVYILINVSGSTVHELCSPNGIVNADNIAIPRAWQMKFWHVWPIAYVCHSGILNKDCLLNYLGIVKGKLCNIWCIVTAVILCFPSTSPRF